MLLTSVHRTVAKMNGVDVNEKSHRSWAMVGIQNTASFKQGDLDRLEVLKMACIKMTVLRDVAGCTLVDEVPKFLRI
jgi:hypothetical protein